VKNIGNLPNRTGGRLTRRVLQFQENQVHITDDGLSAYTGECFYHSRQLPWLLLTFLVMMQQQTYVRMLSLVSGDQPLQTSPIERK